MKFNTSSTKFDGSIGLFDLNTGQKIKDYPQLNNSEVNFWETDIIIFSTSKSQFRGASSESGETLWQLDVTETGRYQQYNVPGPWLPGQVEKFIGIWQGKLYVAITNHTILEVEMQTGEVLRMWRDLPEGIVLQPGNFTKLPMPKQSFIDEEQNLIAGLLRGYYWEIDLQTSEIRVWDHNQTFRELQLSPYSIGQIAHQGDFIFFSSDFIGMDDSGGTKHIAQSAAFNRKSQSIEWRHAFDMPEQGLYQVGTPVVSENYLYVLDSRKTLHIFERTAEVNS